jgi:hypothetical protein
MAMAKNELSLRTGDHGIHDSAVVVTIEGTYDIAASEATSSQAFDIEMAYDDINTAIDSQPNSFSTHLPVMVETMNANDPDEGHGQNVRTVPCENKSDDVVHVSFDEMGSIKLHHKAKDSHDDRSKFGRYLDHCRTNTHTRSSSRPTRHSMRWAPLSPTTKRRIRTTTD